MYNFSNDARLVGIAAYSLLWPAIGLTRSLYLKELYVPEGVLRTGIDKRFRRRPPPQASTRRPQPESFGEQFRRDASRHPRHQINGTGHWLPVWQRSEQKPCGV